MLWCRASMTNLLISSKHVRLNIPIPQNSSIAVTDVFFENQSYNILDGRLEIMVYPNKASKISIGPGLVQVKLAPGYYSNLKTFKKECLAASNQLKTFTERKIIYHLFSRFTEESGHLKIVPSFANEPSAEFTFRINFIDNQIPEYLGLHDASLFVDNQGIAKFPYVRPILKFLNFESRVSFAIGCEEVDTACAQNKEICNIFLNRHVNKNEYIQPRNITFHKLVDNTHSTLGFTWPDGIKIIFLNLKILHEEYK